MFLYGFYGYKALALINLWLLLKHHRLYISHYSHSGSSLREFNVDEATLLPASELLLHNMTQTQLKCLFLGIRIFP